MNKISTNTNNCASSSELKPLTMLSATKGMASKFSDTLNLLGYSLPQLQQLIANSINEPSFRALQLFRFMHHNLLSDFASMANLSKQFVSKLIAAGYFIQYPKMVAEHISQDGVIKWLLEVGNDGNKIETVYIPDGANHERKTLCISSQVGCALECKFCSTARQGFNRNLTSAEIIGQLYFANKRLRELSMNKITNVVMMGMGEPLANYTNVIHAIEIMLNDNAYNLARSKVTLSTSGMVHAIKRLAIDCPVALAISLHASNDEVRNAIIPLNQKYPLSELMHACSEYIKQARGKMAKAKSFITFEYVMLAGVNDDLRYTQELHQLMRQYAVNYKCKFNLIPFNPFPNSGFTSSSLEHIKKFQLRLREYGYITTIRKTRGGAIDAACGQLVGRVIDKTTRQQKYAKHAFSDAS